MSIDPFDTLLDLEKKCKINACPLPLQSELGRSWQGVGFLTGAYHFVAPLGEVKEVIPLSKLSSLPASVDWFMGIANLRGRVLPVTDLQKFMLGTRQSLTPLSRILVMDFEQSSVGFLVTQVLGVQRFLAQPKVVKTEDLDIDDSFKPHVQGIFEGEKQRWTVLSLKKLSEATQFYHVVKELGVQ